MALPNTNLSIQQIASTLGHPVSYDLGTLFLHPNVNEYGFNSPDEDEQKAVWGKSTSERAALSPNNPNYVPIPRLSPGYGMGYFRGYDHDWMAYISGPLDMSGDLVQLDFIFYLDPIPKLSGKPNPGINLSFKVEFARLLSDFDYDRQTVMYEDLAVSQPSRSFYFHQSNPPDFNENGILGQGEEFYIRMTYLDLETTKRRYLGIGSSIYNFITPMNQSQEYSEPRNMQALAVKRLAAPALTLFAVRGSLWADYSVNTNVTLLAQMSKDSSFTTGVYSTQQVIICPPSQTPGTLEFVDSFDLDLSGTQIVQTSQVGDTVYWRLYRNGALFRSDSVVVTNTTPIT